MADSSLAISSAAFNETNIIDRLNNAAKFPSKKSCTHAGRVIKKHFEKLEKGVVHVCKVTANAVKEVAGDSDQLVRALKLPMRQILLYHHTVREKSWIPPLGSFFGARIDFIEAMQFFGHFQWLFCIPNINDKGEREPQGVIHDIKTKKIAKVFYETGFFIADSVGITFELAQVGIINKAKVASKMGSTPVFRELVRFGVVRAVSGVVAGSYIAYGVHKANEFRKAYRKFGELANPTANDKRDMAAKKRQIMLDLIWIVSEVVATGVFFIGGTLVAKEVLLGLGLAAAGLGLIAFIHNKSVKYADKLRKERIQKHVQKQAEKLEIEHLKKQAVTAPAA